MTLDNYSPPGLSDKTGVCTCVSQDNFEVKSCNIATLQGNWSWTGWRIIESPPPCQSLFSLNFVTLVACKRRTHSQNGLGDIRLNIPLQMLSTHTYTQHRQHKHTPYYTYKPQTHTHILSWAFGHLPFQIPRMACLHCPCLLLWFGLCN